MNTIYYDLWFDLGGELDELRADCFQRCRHYNKMYPDDAPMNSCIHRCKEMFTF